MRWRYTPHVKMEIIDGLVPYKELRAAILACIDWMEDKSTEIGLPVVKFNIKSGKYDMNNMVGVAIEAFFGDENV